MEKVKRKIIYRLYPTNKQLLAMSHALLLHQKLYNAALEQRISAYKKQKKSLSYVDQARELTLLRAEMEEYKALNAQSCQVTLTRLDLAFQNFFRRVKAQDKKVGFPRFKSLDRYTGWGYKTHGDGWRLTMGEEGKNGSLRLSGIGQVKIRGKARNIGIPKTCEIQHKQGKWYASITVDCDPKRKGGTKAIGIDWGLSTFATIAKSDGTTEQIANPRFLRKRLKELKSKQRDLSRKKLGSNNRKKAKLLVTKLHAKVSNTRKEFLHFITSYIILMSGLISVEKLNIKSMSTSGGEYKKGLNREILSAAPGTFHQMLKYKAEEAGVEWIEVPTREVKPTQTCHKCGKQEKKALFMRVHGCDCGASCSRDENAAKVILHWALYGNATGQELSSCGGAALVAPMNQETPPITASAV
jgi:putative transposase